MHIQVFHLLPDWNKSHCIHHWRIYLHLIMSGFLRNPLCPEAQTTLYFLRLYFRTMIHLYYTDIIFWSMNYKIKNIIFLSETKYTWIVPIIYLSTLYDRFKFKILVTIYSIECYFILKIPSTVILISIPIRHN